MSECAPVAVVSAWPMEATLRAVAGDPFSFRIVLRDEAGDVVDVSLWEWRATVTTGRVRLDFETSADEGGVRLWMRGDDTARLGTGKWWPYDVACRQHEAGEGLTVLRGRMELKPRVTDPLRHDPDLAPGREEDLVPR